MSRPTIKDLASASGVSMSTVNRVINRAETVRKSTRELVHHTAEQIGFYGLGSIEHSIMKSRDTHRLGIVLQHRGQAFYRDFGDALLSSAQNFSAANIELTLEYVGDLSPENIAKKVCMLGANCESVGVVAAEHPLVSDAITSVLSSGVPVAALIGPLSARGNVGYVGLDNWKKGRMAAWAFDNICKEPGEIGILLGNHRYRNQELNESGFRSYFREHNSAFKLLEPIQTFESAAVAREMTENLFSDHPELCGLFVSGGDITGVLAALNDIAPKDGFVCVGYELFDATRAGLLDGTLTMILSHPIKAFARETIETMVRAKIAGPTAGAQTTNLHFETYTSENV